MVDWLDALIEQTCAQPPTLVGISLGGALAARFAVEHGDRVVQIVLVNSGSLGRALPAPGALVALVRYSIRRSEANFDRLIRYVVVDPERARAGGVTAGLRLPSTTWIGQPNAVFVPPTVDSYAG